MKQKDIALIVVVAIVSVVLASVSSQFLFSKTGAKNQTAEVVDPRDTGEPQPFLRAV